MSSSKDNWTHESGDRSVGSGFKAPLVQDVQSNGSRVYVVFWLCIAVYVVRRNRWINNEAAHQVWVSGQCVKGLSPAGVCVSPWSNSSGTGGVQTPDPLCRGVHVSSLLTSLRLTWAPESNTCNQNLLCMWSGVMKIGLLVYSLRVSNLNWPK